MYKYPVNLNGKRILIQPYNTEKEKDLLIMNTFEVYELDEILRVLEVDSDIIHSLNKKNILNGIVFSQILQPPKA